MAHYAPAPTPSAPRLADDSEYDSEDDSEDDSRDVRPRYTVTAATVGPQTITFPCPFCHARYRKDGRPYARGRHQVHTHGSDGDLSDRVEHRVPHCDTGRFPGQYIGFAIVVDQSTKRVKK